MATVFGSNGSQLVANFYINGSGNSFTNLTVGGNANINNLNVTGNANLGPVGNVHITGGGAGQVLSTDGNGNLSWISATGIGTVTSVGNAVVDPSSLGFTLTGGPITGAGVITLNVPTASALRGTLGIANIGNYPALDGNSSNVLYGNGVWAPPTGGGGGTGTVTSVATGGSGLGFSLTGGPITTTGTVTLATPTAAALRTSLTIGNVANANFNGNGAQVLAGNGAWVTSATPPGGATGQMQFNNGGVFGGSNITYNTTSGNMDMASKNITSVLDPVNAQDAATKFYVDSVAQGLQPKASVQAATTGPITLSGVQLVDGVTLVDGVSRVLVKNQAAPADNGVYVYSSTGPWARATDYDTPTEAADGSFVFVDGGGIVNGSSGFVQTSTVTTLGVDPIVYAQFSTGGSYTAGTGLQLVGSQFSIANTGVVAGTYGNATTVAQVTVDSRGQLTTVANVAIAFPTYGNVANINLDGNVANVLAGDGTWVQNRTNSAGNINEIQLNDGSGGFAASSRLMVNATGGIISSSDAAWPMQAYRYNNTPNNGTTFQSGRARGSKAAPVAVVVNDAIGGVQTYAYTGNGVNTVDGVAGWAESWLIRGVIDAVPTTSGLAPNTSITINATGTGAAAIQQVARFFGGNLNTTFANSITVTNSVSANGLIGINYGTEDIGLSTTAPAAATNIDLLTNSIQYSTANATANVTLNIRGNATTTLNTVLGNAQSTVTTLMMTNGTTAYGVSAVQVDSVAQTIKWSGGSAPTYVANTTLAFTFTVIKTSTTPTYTVLGSMTRFG